LVKQSVNEIWIVSSQKQSTRSIDISIIETVRSKLFLLFLSRQCQFSSKTRRSPMRIILALTVLTMALLRPLPLLANTDRCIGVDPLSGGEIELTTTNSQFWPISVNINSNSNYHEIEVAQTETSVLWTYLGDPNEADHGLYRFTFQLKIEVGDCSKGDPTPRCPGTVISSVLGNGEAIAVTCAVDVKPYVPPPGPGECNHPHCH
jgi:hypothetical protein